MLNGQEEGTVDEVNWHVPYKFYSLSMLRIWPAATGIQGFEVTYTVPEEFTGYEPLTQMFGSSIDVASYEVIQISEELTKRKKFKSDGNALR